MQTWRQLLALVTGNTECRFGAIVHVPVVQRNSFTCVIDSRSLSIMAGYARLKNFEHKGCCIT